MPSNAAGPVPHRPVPELRASGFARIPELSAPAFLDYQDGLRAEDPANNTAGLAHWSRGWEYCFAVHGVREFVADRGLASPTAVESGCGFTPVPFALAGGGCRVTGTDLDPAVPAQWASFRYPASHPPRGSAEYTPGDMEKLPFADGAFDIGYSVSALEHTADPARAVAELCRVTRPGGLVLLTCDVETRNIGMPYPKFAALLAELDRATDFYYPPRWCHPTEVLTFSARPRPATGGPAGAAFRALRRTARAGLYAATGRYDTDLAVYGTARVKR